MDLTKQCGEQQCFEDAFEAKSEDSQCRIQKLIRSSNRKSDLRQDFNEFMLYRGPKICARQVGSFEPKTQF
jgi:hypothetical protein